MFIRMNAWTVRDQLWVALAAVEEDSRGREFAQSLGWTLVPCPRAVRSSRADIAWLACKTATELTMRPVHLDTPIGDQLGLW